MSGSVRNLSGSFPSGGNFGFRAVLDVGSVTDPNDPGNLTVRLTDNVTSDDLTIVLYNDSTQVNSTYTYSGETTTNISYQLYPSESTEFELTICDQILSIYDITHDPSYNDPVLQLTDVRMISYNRYSFEVVEGTTTHWDVTSYGTIDEPCGIPDPGTGSQVLELSGDLRPGDFGFKSLVEIGPVTGYDIGHVGITLSNNTTSENMNILLFPTTDVESGAPTSEYTLPGQAKVVLPYLLPPSNQTEIGIIIENETCTIRDITNSQDILNVTDAFVSGVNRYMMLCIQGTTTWNILSHSTIDSEESSEEPPAESSEPPLEVDKQTFGDFPSGGNFGFTIDVNIGAPGDDFDPGYFAIIFYDTVNHSSLNIQIFPDTTVGSNTSGYTISGDGVRNDLPYVIPRNETTSFNVTICDENITVETVDGATVCEIVHPDAVLYNQYTFGIYAGTLTYGNFASYETIDTLCEIPTSGVTNNIFGDFTAGDFGYKTLVDVGAASDGNNPGNLDLTIRDTSNATIFRTELFPSADVGYTPPTSKYTLMGSVHNLTYRLQPLQQTEIGFIIEGTTCTVKDITNDAVIVTVDNPAIETSNKHSILFDNGTSQWDILSHGTIDIVPEESSEPPEESSEPPEESSEPPEESSEPPVESSSPEESSEIPQEYTKVASCSLYAGNAGEIISVNIGPVMDEEKPGCFVLTLNQGENTFINVFLFVESAFSALSSYYENDEGLDIDIDYFVKPNQNTEFEFKICGEDIVLRDITNGTNILEITDARGLEINQCSAGFIAGSTPTEIETHNMIASPCGVPYVNSISSFSGQTEIKSREFQYNHLLLIGDVLDTNPGKIDMLMKNQTSLLGFDPSSEFWVEIYPENTTFMSGYYFKNSTKINIPYKLPIDGQTELVTTIQGNRFDLKDTNGQMILTLIDPFFEDLNEYSFEITNPDSENSFWLLLSHGTQLLGQSSSGQFTSSQNSSDKSSGDQLSSDMFETSSEKTGMAGWVIAVIVLACLIVVAIIVGVLAHVLVKRHRKK